jgi:UDPglucose--hexose-1-phosphate uridylyltransferase
VSELRWHPLLEQWVVVATHRQDRPQMPKDWCPFCPGSGRVPDHYDVLLYPNDFPSLDETTGGACDVVIYAPDHNLLPSKLTVEQWQKVIGLWRQRSAELSVRRDVEHVYIFENTGEAIGVTMPHPHGQIYAFPFIPPLIETELRAASRHYEAKAECLYCRILAGELEDGKRIVAQNDSFVAFLPYFGRFPAEGMIISRRHFPGISDLVEDADFAAMVSLMRKKYDNLFGFPMPLMMLVRQAPAKGEHPYFHFHVDFYPIQRSPTKLKYLAGVETGAGTFLNDTKPEERAEMLRRS